MTSSKIGFFQRIKLLFIGASRNPLDQTVFHNISLIAFFAWVGLGADGLSSSCYGPPEAFITLGKYHYLGLLVALGTAMTIFIIAESYSQIVELFPTGGGGYIVASKLLSPFMGMVSGSALLIDYILTITLSIASGADALFSFLPPSFYQYRLWFALSILVILIVLNLRGVKESVTVLTPIFIIFVLTHLFVILLAFATHFMALPSIAAATKSDIQSSASNLGIFGMILLLMRSYSMGAGTYTGIEAVSNGLPILREPKVKTAKKTMMYMVISLATVVLGLMFAYSFYGIMPVAGKTLNAVLFERIAGGWGPFGYAFILTTLVSEAAILFVASQAGFIDGPRVLANMAADRWAPKRFAVLSDRLVTMNGILIMGIASIILMTATNGSVGYLIVLYSINVFLTFCLSQTGMVKHWWQARHNKNNWGRKLFVNGIGLLLTSCILIMVTVIKFNEGGWITLVITGSLIIFLLFIKNSYNRSENILKKMDRLVERVESQNPVPEIQVIKSAPFNPEDKTAVVFVKDFTAMGLKTVFSIFRQFGPVFKNYVFVQVGLIDAGAFRGSSEIEKLKKKVENEVKRYKELMERHGYYCECITLFGIDTVEQIEKAAPDILNRYPNTCFFGGQTIFHGNEGMQRILHNFTLFSLRDRLYKMGIPLFVLPLETDRK